MVAFGERTSQLPIVFFEVLPTDLTPIIIITFPLGRQQTTPFARNVRANSFPVFLFRINMVLPVS
jgi:hypothetical protein